MLSANLDQIKSGRAYVTYIGKFLNSDVEKPKSPMVGTDRIGLCEHLSPTRSNGLFAMVKQMRMYALAFQAKN